MGKEKIRFSCGHIEERQLYGPIKEREKKIAYFEKEGLCSECYKKQKQQDVLKNKNGIEMKYSDFKIVENLGIKSVPDTYDASKKTILVALPSGYPKTARGIINHEYAKKLRSFIPRINPNAQKSMELAASKIEHSTKELSVPEMEKMIREIRRDSELENVLKRVSSVLGYDITEDNPDKHLRSGGKSFKTVVPSKAATTPKPVRKLPTKTKTQKKTTKKKTIKGKDGYKKTTISKKGYCVPESKQRYWKRKRTESTQDFDDDRIV